MTGTSRRVRRRRALFAFPAMEGRGARIVQAPAAYRPCPTGSRIIAHADAAWTQKGIRAPAGFDNEHQPRAAEGGRERQTYQERRPSWP